MKGKYELVWESLQRSHTLGFALIFKKLSFHFHPIHVPTSDNQAIKSWMITVRADIRLLKILEKAIVALSEEEWRKGSRDNSNAVRVHPTLINALLYSAVLSTVFHAICHSVHPVHVLQYPVHTYVTIPSICCSTQCISYSALHCTA